MARADALKQLQKTLMSRRNELRRRLRSELAALGHSGSPDTAASASASADQELSSQLAELEARELAQIDQALLRIKQGKYGLCAGCNGKIPIARLNALPYSTLCIKCAREAERDSSWLEDRIAERWGDAPEPDDADATPNDIELDYSR